MWLIAATLLALTAVLLFGGVSRAAAEGPVSAVVLADRAPLVAGQDATLAVQIDIASGYHAQGAKPYDKYLKATSAKLQAGDGITGGAPLYPVALDIAAPAGITDAGKLAVYEGRIWILIGLHVDRSAKPGSRQLHVALTTQACNDTSCLPPQTDALSLDVQVAAAGTATAMQNKQVFDAARQQQFMTTATEPAPVPAPTTVPAVGSAPATNNATVAPPADSNDDANQLAQIAQRDYRAANSDGTPVWILLLYALLGGAILNVMPCVLPVIPLKVLSLVQQARGDRRLAVLHGLAFSAGIITLFMALATVLGSYGLITGTKVFYGMQFNNVAFLMTMSFIVLALALSMLGVWTIEPPQAVYAAGQHRTGYSGSFSMGLLATLLATPCSAPFLGGFLAWAFVQPLPLMVAALALVGVGMAVPYVILAAFPAGLNRLPKAGRWSELFKQFLGIVMIGVAAYLLLQIPDPANWPWAIAGAVVLGAACWGWGQIPNLSMSRGRVWGIRAVVLVLAATAGAALYARAAAVRVPARAAVEVPLDTVQTTVSDSGPLPWNRFSIGALDRALRAGRPVMIDWTADWCINCKYVEATRLQSDDVRKALQQTNALLLRADLTDNPPGNELLAKLGSRSIPFLGIFSPAQPLRPTIFRDIYSKDAVVKSLMESGPHIALR
jgi:thiol:disulfide interchange protein